MFLERSKNARISAEKDHTLAEIILLICSIQVIF